MATLTTDQIIEFLERVIAEHTLSGNRAGLKNAQIAAGFLMTAAEYAGDKDSARTFRILAAKAANKNEEVGGED